MAESSTTPKMHELTTTFVASAFNKEEYEIYRRYQIAVHHDSPDEITEKGYTRFLCSSSLTPAKNVHSANQPFNGYGSFHIQYRLDGKLIGVSVADVLAKGMSSVYFFYDPGKHNNNQDQSLPRE